MVTRPGNPPRARRESAAAADLRAATSRTRTSSELRALGPVEVVCVFGRRGAGKTTLARRLTRDRRRFIAWDPLGEWSRWRDMTTARSLEELRDHMRRRWRVGFRLAIVPPGRDLPGELDQLAQFLWLAQAPFPACPEVALVVDECNLGLPAHRLAAGRWGMSRLVLQGRHRGVAVLAVSQRPALVSMDLRGQAHRTFAFALPAGPDVAALKPILGSAAAAVSTLRPFHYLEADGVDVRSSRIKGGRTATL